MDLTDAQWAALGLRPSGLHPHRAQTAYVSWRLGRDRQRLALSCERGRTHSAAMPRASSRANYGPA